MSKIEKDIEGLKSIPRDFTYDEAKGVSNERHRKITERDLERVEVFRNSNDLDIADRSNSTRCSRDKAPVAIKNPKRRVFFWKLDLTAVTKLNMERGRHKGVLNFVAVSIVHIS